MLYSRLTHAIACDTQTVNCIRSFNNATWAKNIFRQKVCVIWQLYPFLHISENTSSSYIYIYIHILSFLILSKDFFIEIFEILSTLETLCELYRYLETVKFWEKDVIEMLNKIF